jgi:3-methyladenine DNA glycosylase/8-oxoguanine DNA glycosylase
MDDDVGGFKPRDRVMKDLQRTLPGLRMCSSAVLFESLIPRIVEQKVTSQQAHRSYARLVDALGEDAPGPGGLKLLPSPESLASLPYHAYHPFGIERRRADIIRSVARRIPRLQEICDRSTSILETVLTSLPGIGLWTARHISQCVVGDPDAVIVGDYHIPRTVSWLLAGEPRADDERMLELLEPYRGQRGRAVRMIMASGARAPAYGPRRALRRIERI